MIDSITIKNVASYDKTGIQINELNDGSHNFSDDLFIEVQENTTDNYLSVFKGIFEKTDNIGHYNMMMGVESE